MKRAKSMLVWCLIFSMISMTACTSAAPAQESAPVESAPVESANAAETVRIGVVYPMSGPQAETGKQMVDEFQFACDIINGSYPELAALGLPFADTEGIPNLGGAKLELVVADDQNNPELGMSETERLITEEHVHVVLGCLNSGVTKTASAAAEKLGVPFLCPNSSSVELTNRGFEYFFRTCPNDATFIQDTYKYMDELNSNKNAGIKTIALICEDTDYGALLDNGFMETAEEAGYEIVKNIVYPANSTNVTSEVMKVIAANPDAVIMGSYASDAILFVNAFSQQDFVPKAIIGQRGGFVAVEFLEGLGKLADGICTTNVWAEDLGDNNELIRTLTEMYHKHCDEVGVDFNMDVARLFTAVFTLADVLNRTESLEPDDLKEAFKATDIVNNNNMLVAWEGVKFGENGQNERCSGIVTQIQDGAYKTVWPTNMAASESMVPFPAWDGR